MLHVDRIRDQETYGPGITCPSWRRAGKARQATKSCASFTNCPATSSLCLSRVGGSVLCEMGQHLSLDLTDLVGCCDAQRDNCDVRNDMLQVKSVLEGNRKSSPCVTKS